MSLELRAGETKAVSDMFVLFFSLSAPGKHELTGLGYVNHVSEKTFLSTIN